MIFLPNFFDKYTAFLRMAVENLINKKGFNKKQVEMLKKINFAEGYFYGNEKEPLNIEKYIYLLFKISKPRLLAFNNDVKIYLNVNGNFLLNKKLFTILFLQLFLNCQKIRVDIICGKIVIFCNRLPPTLLKTIKALDGYSIKELNSNNALIILNTEKTEKAPLKTNKDWLNVANPYSLINLFLQ